MTILKPLEVLLIEDDPGDVELTKEALEDSKVMVNLHVVEDGVEAMAFLRREDKFAEAVCPDVILLDLSLPKKDGREVLMEVKQDGDLKSIPVVILTTSSAEEDIVRTYTLGANCYVTKPIGLDQFVRVVQSIEEFWFTVVKLPTRARLG